MVSIVDARFNEHQRLRKFLEDKGEVSLSITVEGDFRKVLVVVAASFMEKRIVDALHAFAGSATDARLAEALRSTAFKREKFSSLFDWGGSSVNAFLRTFGEDFKKAVSKRIDKDDRLRGGLKAFLLLGSYRNNLVHNDFADFTFDQTVDDVYKLYQAAFHFAEFLCEVLHEGAEGNMRIGVPGRSQIWR